MRAAAVADRGDDRAQVEPVRPRPTADHPAVEIGVRPVADRPVEPRCERPRRARSVRRADQDSRAGIVQWIGFEHTDGREPAPVGRERGPAGEPGHAEHRTRRLVVVHVDGPDGRPWVRVGGCAQVRRERDRPAIGRPAEVDRAPVAARDLARPGTRMSLDDEQVRPAVEMAGPVPAPIRARDPSGQRRAVGGLCAGGPTLPGPPAADR